MERITTYLSAGVLGSALLLQGCAVGPGFATAEVPAATPSAEGAAGEAADTGAMVSITPDLVRQMRADIPTELHADIKGLLGEAPPYTLGPGDVVGVSVVDHPEFVGNAVPATDVADPASVSPAPGFIVSSRSTLTFPFTGEINVKGMSVEQLEKEVTRRLARVFREPQVSVRMQAFRSKRAYVEGEVRNPGLQVFTDLPMTLSEAINRAGGILPTGDRSLVELTRAGKTVPLDLVRMVELGVDPTRIPLKSGDLVMVRAREDRKVFVMGEVQIPSALPMRNGRLSLNDALGEAGGVNLGTANPRQIYVVRYKTDGEPTVFHLDGRTPTSMALAENFALAPKDVVYVDPVGLARWSRVVNLILPSAQSASLIRGTYR